MEGMLLRSRLSFGVRGQILFLFGISVLLMFAAVVFGHKQFTDSLRAFDEGVAFSQKNAIDIEAVEISFKKQVQEWKDVLLRGKNPDALEKYWAAFNQRETDVRDQAKRVEGRAVDAEALQFVTQFIAAHRTMGDAYRRGLQQFKEHDFDGSAGDQAVAGMDRGPSEFLTKAKERLVAIAESQASETRAVARQSTFLASVLFGLVTAISLIAFFVAIRWRVSRPLTTIVSALRELASGNFAVVLPGLDRRDEIGEIARSVETFKLKLEERARDEAEAKIKQDQIVAEQRKVDITRLANDFEAAVGQIIDTVSSASAEMEASARTLTSTAEKTQELSTTVAAAAEEASANVQTVASASEEMASSVGEISRRVQESARIAGEAVDQIKQTSDRVNNLSEGADRIGNVVELINAIAGQTNLLALNATIEAARAGEAGRGFAVVASEVKSLAEQTAKATVEISEQVKNIQSATAESVTANHQIDKTIRQIAEISSAIAAAVEEQGAASQEISRNVQQAAQGTTQVASNISVVQRGSSETGSASSQVLSTARSLAEESNRLKLELQRFLSTVRAA